MKAITILLAINLLILTNLQGQNWVNNDAEWHYDFYGMGYGFYKLTLGNDTLIQNKICQKFLIKKYLFWPQPGGVYTLGGITDITPESTYASGDTVFYFENNNFFVLYNFNANIGDEWVISDEKVVGWQGYDSLSKVKVIDTGSVSINGNIKKRIQLQTIFGSPFGMDGWVVKDMGSTNNYLFPTARNSDSTMFDFELITFKCFQDSLLGLFNPSGIECEYLLNHLGLNESEPVSVFIYPNPTNRFVWSEWDKAESFHIYVFNELGEKLVDQSTNEIRTKLCLDNYPKGIYLLKVVSMEKTITKKIIVN